MGYDEEVSTDNMRGARESTPLNGKFGDEQPGSMDAKFMIMVLFTSLVLGLAPAIICLWIYYSNGGDKAVCSTPVPSWLYWQGYISGLNTILPMVTVPCIFCLSKQTRGTMQNILGLLGGPLNLFLFVWFICGAVWVFSTDPSQCDPGMYHGAHTYILVCLILIPIFLCCGIFLMCCLMGAALGAQAAQGPGV